jgi:hypothetical protein
MSTKSRYATAIEAQRDLTIVEIGECERKLTELKSRLGILEKLEKDAQRSPKVASKKAVSAPPVT